MNVYYLSVKGSVNLGVNFSVMFHSTNGNDFCSETGSSNASLLCSSTVGYPSDSLASCSFLLSDAVHSADYAVTTLSVCPSVTLQDCVKTAKPIVEILSPSDSPIIIVFYN